MSSTDSTSVGARDLLLTLKHQVLQLPVSGSLQEKTLLSSYLELDLSEQGDLIGHLWLLSVRYGRLLKTFSQDQSLRFSRMDSTISGSSGELGE